MRDEEGDYWYPRPYTFDADWMVLVKEGSQMWFNHKNFGHESSGQYLSELQYVVLLSSPAAEVVEHYRAKGEAGK